jgi:tetratricopeptide (TPR) repeat protein/ADP-heptose:LPS heptosyltransferase
MRASLSQESIPPARRVREALALAYARHAAGRFEEAEDIARTVIALDPRNAQALHLVGEVALRRGDIDGALDYVGRATAAEPRFAQAHNTFGAAKKAAGKPDEAMKAYRTAIRLKPDFIEALSNLGELLMWQGRIEESTVPLRRALLLNPGHVPALNNLGTALFSLERHDEALAVLERAISLRPDFTNALTNLGNVQRAMGRADLAADAHARAVALAPGVAYHHMNYGNSLRELDDVEGSMAAFRRAIALSPNLEAAHNNLGAALLLTERWSEGWEEFEWRWRLGDNPALRARHRLPLWQGDDLRDRHILLWGEQGIGDVVLFASMLRDLLATGAQVSLEVEPRLIPLLKRSFPAIDLFAWDTVPAGTRFDCQANIGRLGLFLRNSPDSFANASPYLLPDPARVAAFKARYAALGRGPRIGISWRSASQAYRRKSIRLEDFAPLFAAFPDAVFVSLQYGDIADDVARAEQICATRVHRDDSFDNWTDLDGLAAQIAALDMVVTVSNLNAHIAGAIGTPAHVLVTQNTLWYWPHQKPTTPWYPSVRLTRITRRPARDAILEIVTGIASGRP